MVERDEAGVGGEGGGAAQSGKSHRKGREYKGNSWDCTIFPLKVLSPPWTRELVDRRGVAGMDLKYSWKETQE